MLGRLVRRFALGVVALLVYAGVVARGSADRDAQRWLADDEATQRALADSVARWVLANDGPVYYHTGESRFDGQSAVAIDQMALLGLGQIVLAHPELRERYRPAMERAAEHLVDPRQLRYAAAVYGQSGLVRIDPGEGHAYLGYTALGLGMLRLLDPDTATGTAHDRIVTALSARLFASRTGLVETYPGETWPPDVAAVAGAIGLHARATGRDVAEPMARWSERFAACAIEPDTGWLRQRVSRCGRGAPRGSGTAIAAYFLSFADPELARRLERPLSADGARSALGFGALREYPRGQRGAGDVDSGPVVFGVSVGATGFGLGAAKATGDADRFVSLYRTTRLFGVPVDRGDARAFAVGGALGNALLLAMLTAAEVR